MVLRVGRIGVSKTRVLLVAWRISCRTSGTSAGSREGLADVLVGADCEGVVSVDFVALGWGLVKRLRSLLSLNRRAKLLKEFGMMVVLVWWRSTRWW